jgi:response regulator of citrate/malate metabolism
MTRAKLTTLLVDDNIEISKRINSILAEIEIIGEIKLALNYTEAKEIFDTQKTDLALLDIHLPGKSGIELLKYIKQSGKPCHTIIMSNQADEYYQKLCKNLGADYFLDKTNDFMLLAGIVRKIEPR